MNDTGNLTCVVKKEVSKKVTCNLVVIFGGIVMSMVASALYQLLKLEVALHKK